MLEGGSFGPEAVAALLEAFDEAVADLELRTEADREKAAKIIIRLARGQVTPDRAKIRAEVARLMRKEGAGRRRPLRDASRRCPPAHPFANLRIMSL
jgi:hypothetical protein